MTMSDSIDSAYSAPFPRFNVKEKDGILSTLNRQYEYKLYRSSYKDCFGVFPELDHINNPSVAIPIDETFWPYYRLYNLRNVFRNFKKMCFDIMPPGVSYSILDNIRVEPRSKLEKEFGLRFSTLMSPIKYIYSLACSEACIPNVDSLVIDEHIVNDLGYRFDRKNRIYYEGTWNHDILIFGMVMVLDADIILFGKFNEDGIINKGVIRTRDSISCGELGEDGLECQEGFVWDTERDIMILGPFKDNLVDGEAIVWDLGSGRIIKQKYIKGDRANNLKYYIYRQRMRFEDWKNTAKNIRHKK